MTDSNSRIELLFRYRIRPGMQQRYQEYLTEALETTGQHEPYVLAYRIFRAEDGTYLQHEVYENEDAVHRHLEVTATAQQAFAESTELDDLSAVGDLSDRFWNRYGGPTVTGYRTFAEVSR